MREKKGLRLFFALWPDERVREKISQFLKAIPANSGHFIPRHNWHMTLHFIGNTTFGKKKCLNKQARKIWTKPFELNLDQTGYFNRPKVFWLGCSDAPGALFELQDNLGKEINCCDYQPETRPYSPHVTVARKVMQPSEVSQMAAIHWQVDRFVLIESVSESGGVRYQVLEEYLFS